MATNIRLKRSSVQGKKPTTSDLQLGELGLNTYDGKIFAKINRSGNENIVRIGAEEPGNTFYVTKNGDDTNDGKSIGNGFATLKYALSVSTSGDSIVVSAGVYTEVFPLEIPTGVSVVGRGIRSTFIQPTEATKSLDGFLLNGETEVTDLTIGNYYYNSTNDTGYGFRFKSGMTTTTRSPYVQRVTVLNKGSSTSSSDPFGFDTPNNPPVSYIAGRGAKIDGSIVNYNTLEPAIFFNECTFICPNSVGLVMTNGARTEWINCFTYFCDKAIDAYDGASGLGSAGKTRIKINGITETSTPSTDDLLYYLEANAKSGTYSRTGTTITITYNSHGLSNGNKIYADFTSGGATDNYYTVSNVSANSFDVTDTVSGSTTGNVSFKKALAYGTISSYSSGTVKLTDKGTGLFETAASRSGKTVTAFGDAKISTAQYKFGTSSLVLDGTGDYIFIPSDTDFSYGTNDFTVEFWYYRVGSGVSQVLFDHRTASSDVALMIGVDSSNQIYTYIDGSIRNQGTTALVQNTWYHIAVSRTSGNTRLFINGTQEGSTYSDSNNYPAKQIKIGTDYAGNNGTNGYIDEVRVSSSSRYSGTFTPPNVELVSDSNTKLLLKFEGDNNSVIIKDSTLQIQDVRIASSSGTGKLTATGIILADYQEFGASMRSIGSAAVFGNRGVVGSGPGVNLRLFAFNFGHIGSGKDFSQDESLIIQANEVIETNNANIQFVSIDQNGDFRVGDAFYVNEKEGIVSFGGQSFNISSLSNLDVTDGTNVTALTPTSIRTGNITLSSNTISTISGDLTIDPAGTSGTTIEGDLTVTGTLNATLTSNSSISQDDSQITITDTGSNGTLSFVADGVTVATAVSTGLTVNVSVTGNNFIPTSSNVPSNGLYLPYSNTLGIATNNSGKVFITADGNVGIGTTNPSVLLDVNGISSFTQISAGGTTGISGKFLKSTGNGLAWDYVSSDSISSLSTLQINSNPNIGIYYPTFTDSIGSAITSLNVKSNKLSFDTSTNTLSTEGIELSRLSVNNSTGSTGQYLQSTGTGLTWFTHKTLTFGNYLTGTSYNGSSAVTIGINAETSNSPNYIVARDSSGNFSAGTITADLSGNSSTTTKLKTPVNINGVSFDGSSGITITANTPNTLTFNNLGSGGVSGITFDGSNARIISYNTIGAPSETGENASGTWSIDINGNAGTATKLETPVNINGVSFDGSSDITITANTPNILTFNNNGSGSGSGATFNGNTSQTISYNTIGAASTTGINASGTWSINVTGNAGTATKLQNARNINGISFDGSSDITITSNTPNILTFDNGGLGVSSGSTFNGSESKLISYNTIGAANTTGTNVSGTWPISVTGNAGTANSFKTARNINGVSFDGSSDITITANTPNTLTLNTSGTGLSGSATFNGGSAQTFTVTSNATSSNTASTIVARDSSGDFSAGIITATLSGNASTATKLETARNINGVLFDGSSDITIPTNLSNILTFDNSGNGAGSGVTFNGSTARTISYNTIGAASTTGTNASGTWSINVTGNAGTATTATNLSGGTISTGSTTGTFGQFLQSTGTGLSWSNPSVSISTDNSNSTRYIVFEDQTSGNSSNIFVSTGLTFNPSTGTLSATKFSGDGSLLTGVTAQTSMSIQSRGESIGTATTLNFGENMYIYNTSGTATITVRTDLGLMLASTYGMLMP